MTQLGHDLWDDEFRARLERQLWALTQELLAQGQSVILEWGHSARVNGMRNGSEPALWEWESNCIISTRLWRS